VRIQRQEQTLLKFVDALSDQRLTPKQREVAVGLAKGSSNREIAAAMGVSINAVAYHIKELFLRLDAHDRATDDRQRPCQWRAVTVAPSFSF
jgi:DNA-binding NarL/FixJ family response regulator